ncbi:MAG: MaoC family dehydratase [Vulcanimicrobiaceae bacterium]
MTPPLDDPVIPRVAERYFEDFTIGETFESAAHTISLDESLAFARAYDPQPFHLDAEAAQASIFKRLVSSGWQTAAVTMRLVVESGVLRATGIIGTGIDDLRWLAPVVPGDTLRIHGEIVEKQPWPGNKRRGILRVRLLTRNQDDVVVMSQIANLVLRYRETP